MLPEYQHIGEIEHFNKIESISILNYKIIILLLSDHIYNEIKHCVQGAQTKSYDIQIINIISSHTIALTSNQWQFYFKAHFHCTAEIECKNLFEQFSGKSCKIQDLTFFSTPSWNRKWIKQNGVCISVKLVGG